MMALSASDIARNKGEGRGRLQFWQSKSAINFFSEQGGGRKKGGDLSSQQRKGGKRGGDLLSGGKRALVFYEKERRGNS